MEDGRALISSIALGKGARLEIMNSAEGVGLDDLLSGLSTTHLSNLCSLTLMEYQSTPRAIGLSGPSGSFSLKGRFRNSGVPLAELPLLPLTKIREFRLTHRLLKAVHRNQMFLPSCLSAIETLAINSEISVSFLLSALFSNPSSPPSLKTLAFLNCYIADEFMEELAQYASKRKETTSARLYRVVIVDPDGVFPGIGFIRQLGERVPVVDVKVGKELPKDLT